MFRKKIFATILILCVLLMSFSVPSLNVSALSSEEIAAPAAVIIEISTGKILYEKNPHEQRPAASLTKIMSMLLVFEAIKAGKITIDEDVTVSAQAANIKGADVFLVEGEVMSVSDMIKASMVASANDATLALAEKLCGTEAGFVEKMNARAKELGMNDTVFKNCNGEEEEGHVTSAYDVALMSAELLKHEKIIEYTSIWLDTLRGGKTQIVNSNKMLKTYSGITGLKTGTTTEAGSCISASATRGDLSLCAVALGCESGTDRFKDATALLDYGFANFKITSLSAPEKGLEPVAVPGSMEGEIKIECEINKKLVLSKDSAAKIEPKIELNKNISPPVYIGEQVGTVKYVMEGELVAEFPVRAKSEAQEMSFKTIFGVFVYWLFAA